MGKVRESRCGGLFLVEDEQRQIPRADDKVFKQRSAPRFARDNIVGVFISLLGRCTLQNVRRELSIGCSLYH